MDVLDVTGRGSMKRQVGDSGRKLGQEPLKGATRIRLALIGQAHEKGATDREISGPSAGLDEFGKVHLAHLVGRPCTRHRRPASPETPRCSDGNATGNRVFRSDPNRGIDELGSEGRPHVVVEVGDVDAGGEGSIDLGSHLTLDGLGMGVLTQRRNRRPHVAVVIDQARGSAGG